MRVAIGALIAGVALAACAPSQTQVGTSLALSPSESEPVPVWVSDNGDGTYANPPLNADYPDPDVIRVGDDFYFISTTFANVPGLTILHSRDLVNWEFASHVVERLDGRPQFDLVDGNAYRNGIYAPSLRHHEGVFYVAVTPNGALQNTRLYMSRTIEGPWEYVELDRHAFDPGLFFDEDGTGYVFTAVNSRDTVTLLTLSEDYRSVVDARAIFTNPGGEGSKVVRRGEYYYVFQSVPRRLGMTVSRAQNLDGPWETRNQIDDTTGGHQGAIVDLADGSDYGFVMLDAGAIGRVTNISPIYWDDGWPVWGTPEAPNQVPATAPKPIESDDIMVLPASDDFDDAILGPQWQWNHNPDNARWSLTEREGFLRLHATQAERFWDARNTLTQKTQAPRSQAMVRLDISNMSAGDQCGFATLGKHSGQLAVVAGEDGARTLRFVLSEDTRDGLQSETRADGVPFDGALIYLRAQLDYASDEARFAYSADGASWTEIGGTTPLMFDWRTGTFQGVQHAIFCYAPGESGGSVDVDWFRLERAD